jgi:hypothetical protein
MTKLTEAHRPPSRGGNSKARHSHGLVIDGACYWFVAKGARRWVFKRDTVSFDFKGVGRFLQVVPGTLEVRDEHGEAQTRGLRGPLKKLRTAPTRLPSSRREAKD